VKEALSVPAHSEGYSTSNSIGEAHSENQDVYLADDELLVYAVADGVGGYKGPKLASDLAINSLKSLHARIANVQELESVVLVVHTRIQQLANELSYPNMGTTISIGVVKPKDKLQGRILTANVGDSPILLVRRTGAEILYQDDSERANKESYRAMRQYAGLNCELKVHTYETNYSNGETLFLCSDGITDNLAPSGGFEAIVSLVNSKCSARELTERAMNARVKKDDLTAVLVHF